ncbi:MAG: (2Fe-2S)-binding protein, partial [Rhizobiaceae bacterium]
RCCGCFPNVVETIIRVTEDYHLRLNQSDGDVVTFLDQVRGLRMNSGRTGNEGRSEDHRAA